MTTNGALLAALNAYAYVESISLEDFSDGTAADVRRAVDAAIRHLVDAGELARPSTAATPTVKACNVQSNTPMAATCACGHIAAVHTRRPGVGVVCDTCPPSPWLSIEQDRSPGRERELDDQQMATMRAAEAQSERAIAEMDGTTWRLAVALAQQANQRADGSGSPTTDPDVTGEVAGRIEQDAQWFARLLANPPVAF